MNIERPKNIEIDIEPLIAAAEARLSEHVYDAAHDLAHHRDVTEKALEIAAHAGVPVDTDSLRVAAMWHDILVPGAAGSDDSAVLAVAEMRSHGMPEEMIGTVETAIRFHEYDKVPQNTEGEILYDADKLTILNIDRWVAMADAVARGEATEVYGAASLRKVFEWTATLKDKMHFDYSRELVEAYKDMLVADPRCAEICKRFDMDVAGLVV